MKQLAASNSLMMNLTTGETRGDTILALLTDDGKIYSFKDEQWSHASAEPANVVGVAIGPLGFWCFDKAGNVHQWNEDPTHSQWTKDTGAGDVTALSSDAKGNLWCTNLKGDVYTRTISFVGLGHPSGKPEVLGKWTKATIPKRLTLSTYIHTRE